MPKKYRLSDKNLIKQCAQRGKKTYSDFLIIKSLTSPEKKFAIVVSKKVNNKATVRNKLRRQIKTLLMSHIESIHTGMYLIVCKDEIQYDFQKIKTDFENMVKHI